MRLRPGLLELIASLGISAPRARDSWWRNIVAGRHAAGGRGTRWAIEGVEHRVNFSNFGFGHELPRALRRALAMFVVGMYLVVGVLHGVCDLDVTNPSSKIVVSLDGESTNHSDKGSLGDHHCHGCFSVTVPFPVVAAIAMLPGVEVVPVVEIVRRGLPPGIDPPPPKSLT